MSHSVEGQEVVLAQGLERNVAGQHQLVVSLVVRERREIERPGREEFGEGAGDAAGGIEQVVVGRIPAESDEEVAHRLLGGGEIDRRPGLDGDQAGLVGVGALEADSGHGSPLCNRQIFVR